ncbi:hypothetical protein FGG08_007144 [Glutinoglossum americanum]|uniref:PH domain-containing protein n=1 Tax=Glutinoglossum americanum TaxID=1670608 RepID=A0A9P8I5Y2_9PEZI|nr:hypothetical protein FGG08_007144 [Glutinoglossum americanum]
MPKASDSGSAERRKSFGFFPLSLSNSLAPVHDAGTEGSALKPKKQRPVSFFSSSSLTVFDGEGSKLNDEKQPPSPRLRPGRLTKGARPSSIFGSLRLTQASEDAHALLHRTISKDSCVDEGKRADALVPERVVLQHGEVQTSGGLFRKRKEYLVLTDKQLLRFKSQSRATEAFPSIPASLGRSNAMGNNLRHTSIASASSTQDLSSIHSHSSADNSSGIPLHQVIAAYKVEDGRPYFSIEVSYMDNETNHSSTMILQLGDPREAESWLASIRNASQKARLTEPTPFPQSSVEYVARRLEQERDYDPAHFRIFKVVQRASSKVQGRSGSVDDLAKMNSSVCYLVIGVYKIHLIPAPKGTGRSSTTSLTDLASRTSYGIVTLTSINFKAVEDAFELTFRAPLRQPSTLHLASVFASEIVLRIREVAEYLRPEWLSQSFTLSSLPELGETVLTESGDEEDHKCFDRTLTAYCAAYDVDTSNICYAVSYDVEEAPLFTLLPPTNPRRPKYSVLELLALLRALRYNESFSSISFRGISLEVLHSLRDFYGTDHVAWTTRSGTAVDIKGHDQKSLLIQELRAIALKSKRLRRMDFSGCIERKPQDDDTNTKDPGCEIVEALFPLCRKQRTNLDWITLSGIELGEADLDYLVDAAVEKSSHFRALEVSRCGLTDRSLQLILNAMLSQENTLESIDISGNLARLSPLSFQGQIGHFGFIRKLNLSRVHRTSGPEPLVAPETMLSWRLTELDLSETPVNEQTVDAVAAYLASSMSDSLHDLRLNQCGLTGRDVAVFLHSMTHTPGVARKLHLHVSENRLEKDHGLLVKAVARNLTPSHMTMKMVDYQKEDHFRELIKAVRKNKTLRYLDISKASLPYDASDETCEALKLMFADNDTLEELDISGEHAHLEVAKFGIGLNHALTGLIKNKALKVLRIEYQKLGFQGANTLSSVLEQNCSLTEVYCEHNDINLQGLTALVGGIAKNKTVLYLPSMDQERMEILQRVEREIQSIRTEVNTGTHKTSVRRTLAAVKTGGHQPRHTLSEYTDQDVQAAVRLMDEKWDRQIQRLQSYLARNYSIAGGLPLPPDEGDENSRPETAIATPALGLVEKASSVSEAPSDKESSLSEEMSAKFGLLIDGDGISRGGGSGFCSPEGSLYVQVSD